MKPLSVSPSLAQFFHIPKESFSGNPLYSVGNSFNIVSLFHQTTNNLLSFDIFNLFENQQLKSEIENLKLRLTLLENK